MDLSTGVVEKQEKPSAKFLFSGVWSIFLHAAVFISNTVKLNNCVRAGRFNFLRKYGAMRA